MADEVVKMTITVVLKDEVFIALEGYRIQNHLTLSKIIEDLVENTLLEKA